MKAILWPILALFLTVCASAQSSTKMPSAFWIQTDEQTYLFFSRWQELGLVDFESEDKAICKMVVFNGSPNLAPVLTVRSRSAVASLRERLLKEGNWIQATPGKARGMETFFRWRLASQIELLPGKGDAKNHLKLVHITNEQPLDLGIVTNAKVVRDILGRIDQRE
jgi:hypothetical protein